MELIDTGPEPFFEDVVNHMAAICAVPVAIVALAGSPRQWINQPDRETGRELKPDETPSARDVLSCAHAVVDDAGGAIPFGDVRIRAFFCAPFTIDGVDAGCLYLADVEPRAWSDFENAYMARAARLVGGHFVARAALAERDGRIELERRLAEAGALHQAVVSSMTDGVIVRSAEGQVIAANDAALDILGVSADQLYGSLPGVPGTRLLDPDGEPFPPERHPGWIARVTGEPQTDVVMSITRPDGERRWIEANFIPLPVNEGSTTYSLATTFTDVTERREREAQLRLARAEAEAANASKSVFLANMSHEIRTPMNGVLGMTQALANTALDPEQQRMLDIIAESGETLMTIINDVLDLSKIEAGRVEIESTPFDLGQLVAGSRALFEPRAREKKIALSVTVTPEAAGPYLGDPTRIRQVLNNLLSNAVKFTSKGEVAVEVAEGPPRADGRRDLTFSVRDTGIGVATDRVEGLFAPFVQEDASTTRRYGGTGLGLAICRQLCELMGGWIDVESTPGAGSTFRFGVPLAPAASVAAGTSAPARLAQAEATDRRPARGCRILAAEDNRTNQQVLASILSPIGFRLEFAANGEEAVEAWARQEFDLILMDIQMPVLDGLEATRAIRDREGRQGRARIPIIALSADAMAHQVDAHLAAGMDGHVAKPIKVPALLGAIAAALEGLAGEAPARTA